MLNLNLNLTVTQRPSPGPPTPVDNWVLATGVWRNGTTIWTATGIWNTI